MDIVKLVIVLFVVGICIYRKYQLGLALLAGAIVMGILYGVSFETWLNVPYQTVTSVSNLHLIAALYFIMAFENILRKKGALTRLLNDCKVLFSDIRAVLIVIPAFIGLIPSFGGALFSAPLVKQAVEGFKVSKERIFLINYWFRHVWEYFLPIFPHMLLGAAILNISVRELAVNYIYLSGLMVIVGALFLVRDITPPVKGRGATLKNGNKKEYLKDLLFVLSPIIAILILVLLAHWEVTWAALLILVVLFIYYRYNLSEIKVELIEAFEFKIIFLVFGVFLFKEMMVQSEAVSGIVGTFSSLGVSGAVMIGAMSAIIGFMSGTPQASVGMVFPLILSFPVDMHLPLAMLGIACGVGGQMISPMHLCFAVTQEYFKSSYLKALSFLIVMELILVASAIIVYYFLTAF